MICCGFVFLHRSQSLPAFAGGHSIGQLLSNLTWASPLFNGASQIGPAAESQRHEAELTGGEEEGGTCSLTWEGFGHKSSRCSCDQNDHANHILKHSKSETSSLATTVTY